MKVLFSEDLSSRMMWMSLTHKWGFISLWLLILFLQLYNSFLLPSYMLSFDTSQFNLSVVSMISDFLFSDQYIVCFHQFSKNVLCLSFHLKTLHSTTSMSWVSTRHPYLDLLRFLLSLVTLTVSEFADLDFYKYL